MPNEILHGALAVISYRQQFCFSSWQIRFGELDFEQTKSANFFTHILDFIKIQ
jgi:hypothetical protein